MTTQIDLPGKRARYKQRRKLAAAKRRVQNAPWAHIITGDIAPNELNQVARDLLLTGLMRGGELFMLYPS